MKAALLLSFLALTAWAEFVVPRLSSAVIDQAGFLSPQARVEIDRMARSLLAQGKGQITVLTVNDLGGLTIEQASIKVTDQWKLGDAKRDDGVLLMLSKRERKVRIEVGQGLEGVLTDLRSKQIISQQIVPRMKAGNSDGAITAGVVEIIRTIAPDAAVSADLPQTPVVVPQAGDFVYFVFVVLCILFFSAAPFFSGGRFRRLRNSSVIPLGGWSGGGGGWSSGSSSGGWSGGGGGFSGGGASGDW